MLNVDVLREQPDLPGADITLTQLDERFFDGVWAALQDPETMRLTGTHQKFTREQIAGFLKGLRERHDRADYAIVRNSDGAYLGEVVLTDLDEFNQSISFRIALSGEALFGRGYGTEATRMVLDFAFDRLGVHRVALEVFDFNLRAQRVYEKCGFVREGVLRDALFWDGQWHDTFQMAVLATERG